MHEMRSSKIICSVGAAVLFTIPSSLCYLLLTYKRSLVEECDSWWLRGRIGRTVGRSLLRLLLWLGTRNVKEYDKKIMAEAELKARELIQARPLPGGIFFVGSSTFTFWTHLEDDMRQAGIETPCWNAAFGGSCSHHIINAMNSICIFWAPSVVVYFCGTNDLNMHENTTVPFENFKLFHDLHHLNRTGHSQLAYLLAPVIKRAVSGSSK